MQHSERHLGHMPDPLGRLHAEMSATPARDPLRDPLGLEGMRIFMDPLCPAPALLGHRDPCYCAEAERPLREAKLWGTW